MIVVPDPAPATPAPAPPTAEHLMRRLRDAAASLATVAGMAPCEGQYESARILVSEINQRFHSLVRLHLSGPRPTEGTTPAPPTCTRPPKGWVCSREAGHAGPCAADTIRPRQEFAQALSTNMGWPLTAINVRDVMPMDDGGLQFQANYQGHTDWYSIQTDAAGQLDPATIKQQPY